MDLKKKFIEYKNKLEPLLPFADIQHVGGSSIPGATTKGELDISLRISLENMEKALQIMDTVYLRKHEELWNKNFAIYKDYQSNLKVDIMVSVIGSAYDSFVPTRDLLINNADLLNEYNEIKSKYAHEHIDILRKHKRAFFDRLFETHMDLES